ncbi:restriction endonuclease subunit S [Kitasatospora cinereorecta]
MTFPTLPIRRVFKVVNGGTPTPDADNWGGEISWATPADFGAQFSHLKHTRRTLTSTGASTGSTIVPAGSLLVSTRAPIGYVAINSKAMAFNQGCRALVPRALCDTRLFGYQLEARTRDLQAEGFGTTFTELSSDKLGSFHVTVPPLEEQRRIADFLDAETAHIDQLTAKRSRMQGLLQLKRERFIESTLGLERESKHHSLVPLKYLVADVTVGIVITPAKWYVESGGTPALRGTNVKPGSIDASELVHISAAGDTENAKSRLKTGDVVVVRTGQAGAAAVVPSDLDGSNCIDLIIVRPGMRVDPEYLEYVLNSDYSRARVSEHSVGSIQAHFNVGAMKEIPIPSLPVSEQKQIVTRLRTEVGSLDLLKQKLARQNTLLAERRQALITAAVTGQFDVSTASGRNVTDGVNA